MPFLTQGCVTVTLTKKSVEKLRIAQKSMERLMVAIRLLDKKISHTKVTDVIERIAQLKWS